MASLESLTAEVRRTAGVAASIKVAVDGLKAKIADLEAQIAALPPSDQAAIDALQAELDTANDVLELVTAVGEPTA